MQWDSGEGNGQNRQNPLTGEQTLNPAVGDKKPGQHLDKHPQQGKLAYLQAALPELGKKNQELVMGTTVDPMRELFAAIATQLFNRVFGVVKISFREFFPKQLLFVEAVVTQQQRDITGKQTESYRTDGNRIRPADTKHTRQHCIGCRAHQRGGHQQCHGRSQRQAGEHQGNHQRQGRAGTERADGAKDGGKDNRPGPEAGQGMANLHMPLHGADHGFKQDTDRQVGKNKKEFSANFTAEFSQSTQKLIHVVLSSDSNPVPPTSRSGLAFCRCSRPDGRFPPTTLVESAPGRANHFSLQNKAIPVPKSRRC